MYPYMLIPLREYEGKRSFGQVSHYKSWDDARLAMSQDYMAGPNPSSRGWLIVDTYGEVDRYSADLVIIQD